MDEWVDENCPNKSNNHNYIKECAVIIIISRHGCITKTEKEHKTSDPFWFQSWNVFHIIFRFKLIFWGSVSRLPRTNLDSSLVSFIFILLFLLITFFFYKKICAIIISRAQMQCLELSCFYNRPLLPPCGQQEEVKHFDKVWKKWKTNMLSKMTSCTLQKMEGTHMNN